jgi:hypothetical protein
MYHAQLPVSLPDITLTHRQHHLLTQTAYLPQDNKGLLVDCASIPLNMLKDYLRRRGTTFARRLRYGLWL